MFLSDGRPSDKLKRGDGGGYERLMKQYTCESIGKLASSMGKQLSFCAIGIGQSVEGEFRILKAMVDEAKENTTRIAEYPRDEELRTFQKQPLREIGAPSPTATWRIVNSEYWTDPVTGKSKRSIVRTKWVIGTGWVKFRSKDMFSHKSAVGVAFESRWFGEGRERLAKEFREIDRNERFVGQGYVAKDSITVHHGRSRSSGDPKDFHKAFCIAQLTATKVALEFNRLLSQLPISNEVPRVEFLECSVYMLVLDEEIREGFLVEPMLDIKRFPYTKFNDNQGRFLAKPPPTSRTEPLERGLQATNISLMTIQEVENESDEEGEDELEVQALSDLVPQAFSCFSYHFSYKQKLVCDLQGIFDIDKNKYVFTDPVVHQRRADNSATKSQYGRTDLGMRGIKNFFSSHRCSLLCKQLQSVLKRERRRDDSEGLACFSKIRQSPVRRLRPHPIEIERNL